MKSRFILLFLFLYCLLSGQSTKRDLDSVQAIIDNTKRADRIAAEKAVLSLKYYTSGNQKKSESLYREAIKIALSAKADSGLAMAYHVRGTMFYYETKYDSALSYLERALTIRKRIKDNIGILKTTLNIGSMYYMFGDLQKALTYYEEVQKKEAELHFDEGTYFSINNVGYIYQRLKMPEKAKIYFRKAEKINIKNNKKNDLIFSYDGLSDVYHDLKKNDSALYYAFKSLKFSEEQNDLRALSYSYNTVGLLYMAEKKFDLAKEYYDKGLLLARKLKDKRLEMTLYGNFSALEIEKHTPENAGTYIEKLVKLKEELNIKANQEELAKVLAQYYYDKKDYKNAYDQLNLYDRYTDSLYNAETTGKLTELQEKYEADKKEQKNQLLQSENNAQKTTQNFLLVILAIAALCIVGSAIAFRKIKKANYLLAEQKLLVEEKQKEILDSIHYARRIQLALLASDNLLRTHLPDHFVLFKPKAVVSGDFYWATPSPDGFVYITADCTGHGVPGAFMSLLNISKLSQTVNENKIDRPDLVLNHVRSEIISALNPKDSLEESKDGMDAVLCKLNIRDMKLEYAAANNAFYIIRNGNLLTCKPDKMPVGKGHNDTSSFTYNEIALQKGDTIYTFTDGYADQFGGAKGKKYKYKQLEDFLLSIAHETMEIQKQKLDETFELWRGKLEQVDDVCIIGVRV